MDTAQSHPPVVVGIDGSEAAIQAAQWAVVEAADRKVPLRLVYVIDDTSADAGFKFECAESALRATTRALAANARTSPPIETSIVQGPIEEVLLDESKAAAMICVGSVGIGRMAWMLVGSTAAALAQKGHCPVAIIRRHAVSDPSQQAPIAVAVDNSHETDAVVATAMRQASLRHTSVLAVAVDCSELGFDEFYRRLQRWRSAHPGVRVDVVAAHRGFSDFLAHTADPVQLAVIGSDVQQAVGLVGPVSAGVVHHARCSVLVVPTGERAAANSQTSGAKPEPRAAKTKPPAAKPEPSAPMADVD